MLFICGTCAPAQPEADDDKCENVDDVHGLSPGVALTVVASPLPCPALPCPVLPPPTGHSSICGSIPRCVFVCDKIFTCLQIERLELSSVCFACFMPRLRWLPSPTPSCISYCQSPLLYPLHLACSNLFGNCANCSRRDNLIKHISLCCAHCAPLLPRPASLHATWTVYIVLGQTTFPFTRFAYYTQDCAH